MGQIGTAPSTLCCEESCHHSPAAGLQEVKPEVEKESTPSEKVYEKDDFFDQLSCEALERLSLGGGGAGPGQPGKLPPRTRFAEQRKLDIETFGGTGIARRNNFGRGRGGRRGGRGVRSLCPAMSVVTGHTSPTTYGRANQRRLPAAQPAVPPQPSAM